MRPRRRGRPAAVEPGTHDVTGLAVYHERRAQTWRADQRP
jgi:hypothetical protein